MKKIMVTSMMSLAVALSVGFFVYAQDATEQQIMQPDSTEYVHTSVVVNEPPAIRMLHFGDMMLDRGVASKIRQHGFDYLLQDYAGPSGDLFAGYDLVGANLEGPFTTHRVPTSKSIAFRFDPSLVNELARYHFNIFTLANNHSKDMGSAAEVETRTVLASADMLHYGYQYKITEESLAFYEHNGVRLAFIGINDTNSWIDVADVLPLLKHAESQADYTVVNVHWGHEYKLLSNERQRGLAHDLIDHGADMIIGHHPHVVQEIEVYRDRPIFYSLGNMIFDQWFSRDTQEGLGIAATFGQDQTLRVTLKPFQSVASAMKPMTPEREKQFLSELRERSRLYHHEMIGGETLVFDLSPRIHLGEIAQSRVVIE